MASSAKVVCLCVMPTLCFCVRVHVCETLSDLPGKVPEPLLGKPVAGSEKFHVFLVCGGRREVLVSSPHLLDSVSAPVPSGGASWMES